MKTGNVSLALVRHFVAIRNTGCQFVGLFEWTVSISRSDSIVPHQMQTIQVELGARALRDRNVRNH